MAAVRLPAVSGGGSPERFWWSKIRFECIRQHHLHTLVGVELIKITLRSVFVEISIKKKEKLKKFKKNILSDAISEVLFPYF